MACEQLEELGGQALGGEVDHADRAARPAHAHQLVGDRPMVGREDRADRGGHHVELAVGERQRLGVGVHPLELHASCVRLAAARLEVLRREVRRDDLCPRLGGADRDVPGAGGDVEHPLAGGDPARLHQHRAEPPHRVDREAVIVAERPHGALLGLAGRHLLDPGQGRGLQHGRLHARTVCTGEAGGFATTDHLRGGREWPGLAVGASDRGEDAPGRPVVSGSVPVRGLA
jgi:hypothetical protein